MPKIGPDEAESDGLGGSKFKDENKVWPSFRLSKALWWVFLTLWVTFFLLGFGSLLGAHGLTRAGGWIGLLCGLLAMYTSFALVTNSTFGKTVLPLGAPCCS